MKPHPYERRVCAAYRVLHPCKTSNYGAIEWFRQAVLKDTDITISKTGIKRWLTGVHTMPADALLVLLGLERDALYELHMMRKTIG